MSRYIIDKVGKTVSLGNVFIIIAMAILAHTQRPVNLHPQMSKSPNPQFR